MSRICPAPAVLVAALAAWLAAGPTGARADYVTNGGFETGNFSGWTVAGGDATNTNFVGVDATNPHSGTYEAYFGAPTADGLTTLTQSIATNPGSTYRLSFYLANDTAPQPSSGFHNAYHVNFGTAALDQADVPQFDYTQITLMATATANLTTLMFSFNNDLGFFNLDDVSITVVPEPSGLALLAIGGGATLMIGRARRQARPCATDPR